MSKFIETMNLRIVALLLLLELLSVYFLWTLNSVGERSEGIFGLFLAVDLVSFSMISYIYRVDRLGDKVRHGSLFAGCCVIVLLLFVALFL
jgi:hypothetical protein